MRSRRISKKLLLIVAITACLIFILLKIFSDNISLFLKPAEVYEKINSIQGEIRIGGYVKNLKLDEKTITYSFIITDNNDHDILVTYKGMLPSLFKEEQMSVVTGQITKCNKVCFQAREVLAKHDENYKP